jgi:hypothetical protein
VGEARHRSREVARWSNLAAPLCQKVSKYCG